MESPRVPGQTIQTYQIRVYMNARNLGLTQADAAFVAEFSERSAQRIDAGTHQPQRCRPSARRASADPLAQVWDSGV